MTEHEWFLAHHLKEGTDPDEEEDEETEGPKAKAIPPMPVIDNPGYVEIEEKWKEGEITRNRETQSQLLQSQ